MTGIITDNEGKKNPLLRIRDLALHYSSTRRTAFERVDFELQVGEIIAIIGPSGCGKSSLLKTIAAVHQPSRGDIQWRNNKPPEWAYIFQDPTLLPWMTAMGNVEVPLKLRGIDKTERKRKCEEAIQRVLLQDAKSHYPKALSGGMRMRVSLARALSLQPELMFLDEPFGALDAITRNQMNELILRLQREAGWGAILVTHSVNEAVYLADKILVMSASPGSISEQIEIELPRDRKPSLQTESVFQDYVLDIRNRLNSLCPNL